MGQIIFNPNQALSNAPSIYNTAQKKKPFDMRVLASRHFVGLRGNTHAADTRKIAATSLHLQSRNTSILSLKLCSNTCNRTTAAG
mmetsp:Transcript_28470/g.60321  ORF Transcript_28470/g.60321 Transcript_28470/m.60321 type:complete len:85 (+) Transcript_28470:271-525(+)